MTELELIEKSSLEAFAGRFQTEKLGLVYYENGLGAGGWLVTHDERRDYINRYANLLLRNKRWFQASARLIFILVPIGLIAALFSFPLAMTILISAIALWVANLANSMIGPIVFEKRISFELRDRVLSRPLDVTERIERGYAWPLWKSLLFWLGGVPLIVLLMLHRAGRQVLISILGPDLAHTYELFIVAVLVVSLLALPFAWWKERKRSKDWTADR